MGLLLEGLEIVKITMGINKLLVVISFSSVFFSSCQNKNLTMDCRIFTESKIGSKCWNQNTADLQVGIILTSQKDFYLENNKFAKTLKELGVSEVFPKIPYEFEIQSFKSNQILIRGIPTKKGLKKFTGLLGVNIKTSFGKEHKWGVCQFEPTVNDIDDLPHFTPILGGNSVLVKCPDNTLGAL